MQMKSHMRPLSESPLFAHTLYSPITSATALHTILRTMSISVTFISCLQNVSRAKAYGFRMHAHAGRAKAYGFNLLSRTLP